MEVPASSGLAWLRGCPALAQRMGGEQEEEEGCVLSDVHLAVGVQGPPEPLPCLSLVAGGWLSP